jgi:flagellin-like hook-associated protein FlgL
MAIGNLVAFADTGRARTNIAAWNLINQVNSLNRELTLRQLRIATGKQQPRMEDGASFFAIWNKMKNQVRGKGMAIDNIGDAKDELSLAESGLLQIDEMLGKMRDLAVRAANETLTEEQREDARQEFLNLYITIANIVKRTRFNEGGEGEDALLDGFSHTYQVGPNETELDRFTVEIPNILLGITRAFCPELGEKLEAMREVFLTLSEDTREGIATEVRSYANTLPEGGIRNILEALADAFEQPDRFEAGFLTELAKSGLKGLEGLDQHLETLFETRLDTLLTNAPLKDFQTDDQIRQALHGLAPLIGALNDDPATLTTLADTLENVAAAPEVTHEGLVTALRGVSSAIREIRDGLSNTMDSLESEINTKLNSPTQRLFLAQDIVFFASADTAVAARPAVQNALNQLALDIVNEVEGLPNFKAAVSQLSEQDRAVFQSALSKVATDPQNGLSFHIAVPDLDGTGGPFSTSANTFASFLVNIAEQLPGPEDTNDVNLATVLSSVADTLDVQYPRIAARLSTIVSLLTDNDDTNDAALADALTALAQQIESDSGTSNFFTNPIDRNAIRNAFLAPTGSQAFANLSAPMRNAYLALTDSIAGVLDLNAAGAPLATNGNTFASLVLGITEKNPQVVPADARLDDVNMAALLQNVAGALAGTLPEVASLMNNVVSLLANETDGDDAQLATALRALGAKIEAISGGQNVDGEVRAELRRVLLEQTGSQAFNQLSLSGKAAYLTLAESLGAYTAQEIASLDAHLDAIANALIVDTTELQEQLAGLANQLADETVSGEERQAVIGGFAEAAAFLEGDDANVIALKNALDDPGNDDQVNPSDLVGILTRHIPNTQNQTLQSLLSNSVDWDWENAIQDFLKFDDNTDAGTLIGGVDDAINFVKDALINLGGVQTKLTSLQDILTTSETAEDSVASRFGDADLAKEQVELAKLQLFSQLATAQVAAANTLPSQLIAGLFGGG